MSCPSLCLFPKERRGPNLPASGQCAYCLQHIGHVPLQALQQGPDVPLHSRLGCQASGCICKKTRYRVERKSAYYFQWYHMDVWPWPPSIIFWLECSPWESKNFTCHLFLKSLVHSWHHLKSGKLNSYRALSQVSQACLSSCPGGFRPCPCSSRL
jgi:hypothetical protein